MKFRTLLRRSLIVIFAGVFIFSAWQLLSYYLDSQARGELYDDLAALVEQADELESTLPQDPEADSEDPTAPAEPTILRRYEKLYEQNTDLVGWIQIADTNINYPVMQTPEEPNYYLHADFYHKYSSGGCLYAQENCDVNAPSDNVVIYGHHMKDGSMFANLDKFNQKTFWEEHKTFRFDTLYQRQSYEIFAVFKTTASVGEGFDYHAFVDGADAAEFDAFVQTCKDLSFYDTGVTPQFGDKLLCLSTCEYTQTNGRLVVAAVRVD